MGSRIKSIIDILMKLPAAVAAGGDGCKCPLFVTSSLARWIPGHYIEYVS